MSASALLFVLPDWNLFLPSLSHFLSLLVTQYIPWCNNTFLWLSGGRIGRYSINSSRDSLQLPSYIFCHLSTANLNLPFWSHPSFSGQLCCISLPVIPTVQTIRHSELTLPSRVRTSSSSDSDTARTLIYPSRQASSTLWSHGQMQS